MAKRASSLDLDTADPAASSCIIKALAKYATFNTSSNGANSSLTMWHRVDPTDQITDFTIKCGGREWKVHRLVLFLHSKVLAAACSKGFKV